jgi:hypothetical protein
MPSYTLTLTDTQDAALGAIVTEVNKTGTTYTKASYIQERMSAVAESYVAQAQAEEAQEVADAYQQASAAEQASVKSTLKVS